MPSTPHPCAVTGCPRLATSGYSSLCTTHRSTQHRHGHPLQTAVKVSELRPYRELVAKRRKANPESPAWAVLEERWGRVQAHAQDTLAARQAGKAFNRWDAQAAQHLQALAAAVPASEVMEVALAMVIMREKRPSRFASDRGFAHQLVRRVRSLADTSSGSYWDPKTQRMKRVYRNPPPRTVERIAGHLMGAFGAAGMQLANLDQVQAEAATAERLRLEKALIAMR